MRQRSDVGIGKDVAIESRWRVAYGSALERYLQLSFLRHASPEVACPPRPSISERSVGPEETLPIPRSQKIPPKHEPSHCTWGNGSSQIARINIPSASFDRSVALRTSKNHSNRPSAMFVFCWQYVAHFTAFGLTPSRDGRPNVLRT